MVKPFRRTACNIFGIVFCVYIFWWLYLFYLGALPAGVALVLGLLPLLIALRLVRSLYRSVHGHEVSPV